MVRLYKECYGKGPTKARTHAVGDVVVCILEGGFMKSEQTLRDAGRPDAVTLHREAFQDALRNLFIDVVEQATGRSVLSFMSGVDLETETSAEVFVLEPLDTGDEREAVAAWGEQTRRQNRALRERQAELRSEQVELRQRRSPRAPEDLTRL